MFVQIGFAQVNGNTETPIDLSEIWIQNQQGKVKYETKLNELIEKFGQPESLDPFYYEIDEKDGFILGYGNSEFFIQNDMLYLFSLKSSDFALKRGNNSIRVGDSIDKIDRFYPGYFIEDNFIIARIKTSAGEIDGGLVIETDGSKILAIDLNFH
ncbi:MAG: hypothetical protein Q8S14_10610 [Algoriphagus sp.]|uniref:hypothetical protein n=1 Tax=Algoriphagus sp. TaxID=1872435 RepID=UPI00272EFFE8|nr:hypothetical protein [Algoriphagus sp.]MDP2041076.1 hypothetical protein [Algoriphagus sp.]MDP3472312.1 hypothetical protein [Algoriphagus sp.]